MEKLDIYLPEIPSAVIGIDPGPTRSAVVQWTGQEVSFAETFDNPKLLALLHRQPENIICEQIECFGMPVGQMVFQTVFWTGRFYQVCPNFTFLPRRIVKLYFCQSTRAKDTNVIQAIKTRFEPGLLPRQRPKGILKKIKGDQWQALALAIYFYEEKLNKSFADKKD